MKILLFPILVLILISVIVSCEDLWDDVIEKEAIVDGKGGIIGDDNITIEIPQGALIGDNTISLITNNKSLVFKNDKVSDVYILKGIPINFNKHIKIKIKYEGVLKNESFIALGSFDSVSSLYTFEESFRMLPVTDSSGYLIAYIEPGPTLKNAKKSGEVQEAPLELSILAITNYIKHTTAHFSIVYPSSLILNNNNPVEKLAEALETSYESLKGIGFSYSGRAQWPVEVTIKNLNSSVYGYSTRYFPWTANCGVLEFNVDKMNEIDEIKTTAAHEFFHLIQDFYNSGSKYTWVAEASSVWFEKFLSTNSNYSSKMRSGNKSAPFMGINPPSGEDAAQYGYGMSSLVKYLADKKGDSAISKLWDEIKKGKSPGDAVKTVYDEPFILWWESFYRNYIMGKIYNDVSPLDFSTSQGTETFNISGPADTAKYFSGQMPDLSGKFFIVKPTFSDIDPSSGLEISTKNSNMYISVFKYKNSDIEFLSTGFEKIQIPELKKYIDEKSFLLILLTNNSDNSPDYKKLSDYSLKFKINAGQLDLSFINNVRINFLAFCDAPDNDGLHSCYYRNNTRFGSYQGKFVNNTLKISVSAPPDDFWYGTTTISFSIKINPKTGILEIMSYQQMIVETELNPGSQQVSFSAGSINFTEYVPFESLTYNIKGSGLCSKASFNQSWSYDGNSGSYNSCNDSGIELMSGEEAYLSIVFVK